MRFILFSLCLSTSIFQTWAPLKSPGSPVAEAAGASSEFKGFFEKFNGTAKSILEMRATLDTLTNKKLVIFLGKTGTGKSTAINWLYGNPLKVEEKKLVVDGMSAVTAIKGGTASCTSIPQFVNFGDYYLCDFPGLEDSKGDEQEVINAICMREVLGRNNLMSFVLVSSESQFKDRGEAFQAFIGKIRKIFGNLGRNDTFLANSMLLVTKFDHLTEVGIINSKSTSDLSEDRVQNINFIMPLLDNYFKFSGIDHLTSHNLEKEEFLRKLNGKSFNCIGGVESGAFFKLNDTQASNLLNEGAQKFVEKIFKEAVDSVLRQMPDGENFSIEEEVVAPASEVPISLISGLRDFYANEERAKTYFWGKFDGLPQIAVLKFLRCFLPTGEISLNFETYRKEKALFFRLLSLQLENATAPYIRARDHALAVAENARAQHDCAIGERDDAIKERANVTQQLEEMKVSRNRYLVGLNEAMNANGALTEAKTRLQNDLDAAREAIRVLIARLKVSGDAKDALEVEKKGLTARLEAEKKEVQRLTQELQKERAAKNALEVTLKGVRNEKATLEERLAGVTRELNDVKNVQKQLADLQKKLDANKKLTDERYHVKIKTLKEIIEKQTISIYNSTTKSCDMSINFVGFEQKYSAYLISLKSQELRCFREEQEGMMREAMKSMPWYVKNDLAKKVKEKLEEFK